MVDIFLKSMDAKSKRTRYKTSQSKGILPKYKEPPAYNNKMVKDREEELNVVENENKVERVQDLFPNDDLQLREKDSKLKSKLLQRRRSAPSAVLLKSLGGSSRTKIGAAGIVVDSSSGSSQLRGNNALNRLYVMEGPVQLTAGLQTQGRYLFLFNDVLLIAKQKSNTTFKLKNRIRVCEMWTGKNIDDVCELTGTPDKSFVMGWPTTNVVATFSSPVLKEQWLAKLNSQISEEKSKEQPQTVSLKVINKDMEDYPKSKEFPIGNHCEASECVQKCIEEFGIQEGDAKDFHLWVVSGKEDAPYPLIGHEHPYSIKMSHIRDGSKVDADGLISPVDIDTSPDKVDRNTQCQFMLRNTKKPKKFSLDDGHKKSKKTKKSPLINIFKKSQKDLVSPTSPCATGRLFGHVLSDLCSDDTLPKPIMDMLTTLFHQAPFMSGMFRKSASARVCRELREKLDFGLEICPLDEPPVLVTGATFKEFLRSMPDCLLQYENYDEWTNINDVSDTNERVEAIKRIVEKLPVVNRELLRHFMCILYYIDKKSDENKMNAYNLGVCVGPSLLWPDLKAGPEVQAHASKKVPLLVQFMVENCEQIFGEECLKLFGELEENKVRQDSSTDSDSIHSLLSMQDGTGMLGNKESSLDSLECNEYYSYGDSSPRLMKSHLSPSTLSKDSGLTLSDSQLFDEDTETDSYNGDRRPSYNRSSSQIEDRSNEKVITGPHSHSFEQSNCHSAHNIPVPPPRKGKQQRRGSEPPHTLEFSHHQSYKLMQSHSGASLYDKPQQSPNFSNSANADLMRHMRCNFIPQKRISNDSDLGSLEEDTSVQDYYLQRVKQKESGIITKSASGTHLFIDDQLVAGNPDSANYKAYQLRQWQRMQRQSSHETPPTSPMSQYSHSSQESLLSSETTPPPYHRVFRPNKGRAPSPPRVRHPPRRCSDPLTPTSPDKAFWGDDALSQVMKKPITSSHLLAPDVRRKSASAPSSPDNGSPVSTPRTQTPDRQIESNIAPASNNVVPQIKLNSGEAPPPLPPKSSQLTLTMAAQRNSMPVGTFYDPNLGSPPPQVVLRKLSGRGTEVSPLRDTSLIPVRPGIMKRHTFTGALSPRLSALDSSLSSERIPEEQIIPPIVARTESCKTEKPSFLQNNEAYAIEKSASDTRVAFHLQRPNGKEEENVLGNSNTSEVVMKRPAKPPSYNEALERKSLIESGVSEIERIRQTVKSAKARELFVKSQQQYEQQHTPQSSPKAGDKKEKKTDTESDTFPSNTLKLAKKLGNSLNRSKSDSCEHINKIGQSNIKHLKPVQINADKWRKASPDRRSSEEEPMHTSEVNITHNKMETVKKGKLLSEQQPLFYLPQGEKNAQEGSVPKSLESSRENSLSPKNTRKDSPSRKSNVASRENSFTRKRHSPSVTRENSIKNNDVNDENSPPNSKRSEISWSVSQMKNMFDTSKDQASSNREVSPLTSGNVHQRIPPPYRPPPDINSRHCTPERNSNRNTPEKQQKTLETLPQSVKNTVKDYFMSADPINGLRSSQETAAELARSRQQKNNNNSDEHSLEEALQYAEESYV